MLKNLRISRNSLPLTFLLLTGCFENNELIREYLSDSDSQGSHCRINSDCREDELCTYPFDNYVGERTYRYYPEVAELSEREFFEQGRGEQINRNASTMSDAEFRDYLDENAGRCRQHCQDELDCYENYLGFHMGNDRLDETICYLDDFALNSPGYCFIYGTEQLPENDLLSLNEVPQDCYQDHVICNQEEARALGARCREVLIIACDENAPVSPQLIIPGIEVVHGEIQIGSLEMVGLNEGIREVVLLKVQRTLSLNVSANPSLKILRAPALEQAQEVRIRNNTEIDIITLDALRNLLAFFEEEENTALLSILDNRDRFDFFASNLENIEGLVEIIPNDLQA